MVDKSSKLENGKNLVPVLRKTEISAVLFNNN